MNKKTLLHLLPVMLCFFVMGFVDMVGIATNYLKVDLNLSDTEANIFPSMVFFWFLIFSVPSGMLMNRIGRVKTVLLSVVVTCASLVIPVLSMNYWAILISFSLLGIGNTIMQVSLNPLVATVIGEKNLESSLTFGQFVKAIASFVAPILAAYCAAKFGSWSLIFPVFAAVSIFSALWLGFTPIQEKITQTTQPSFIESISLLKNPAILLAFLGIMCHVGLDVGTNVTAPKILIERASMTLETAGYVTSIYFLFRTIGSFTGSFIMTKISSNKFFVFSVVLMLLGMGTLLFASNVTLVYVCVAMIGYGNSNIFPVIFARALQNTPEHQNSVSGLMIMGLFGGTVFPLVMGMASDAFGQIAAVAVMLVGVIYLMLFNKRIAA